MINVRNRTGNSKKSGKINITRIVLFFLGTGLVIAGVVNGEYKDVLMKAVYICLECIGIG